MRNFDYKNLKDIKWDNEILGLVAQIHEYKGKQMLLLKQKPATLEKLVDIAKIQSTEASNKIEGIITTAARMKQLCEQKTTPRNRDEEEISGYRDVLSLIHESYEYIPIRPSYILQMHQMLYRYSQKGIGGYFKNTRNYIVETKENGEQIVRFTPLDPFETPIAIEAICESFNREMDFCEIDPLILIPAFIIDFLCIHPFNDGNGRMSRLLTTLLLYRAGYVVGKYVSLESKIEKTKTSYYEALEESDRNWNSETNDITPFIKYMLGIVLGAYRDLEDRLALVEGKSSALELVRNAVSNTIGKFTKSNIMELVPSIGKTSIENSLKTLIEEGVIGREGKGKATFYFRKNDGIKNGSVSKDTKQNR
ncbi:MAG TPA: cell filamentation protein Fic [Firmicutes bacterium]|nr:cell filamentation protein Fic [Bacillota bacterium]